MSNPNSEVDTPSSASWVNIWRLIEPFIRSTLDTYLVEGPRVELSVGFSGALNLSNVQVKTEALESVLYGLPFDLKSIKIGHLHAWFPIFQLLGHKHVEATVSNVVVEIDWGELKEIPTAEKLAEYVKSELTSQANNIWSEFRRLALGQPGEGALLGNEETGSFVSKLVARLVKNVRIIGKDVRVHIRFKNGDRLDVFVDELEILTANSGFLQEVFDSSLNRMMQRLVHIRGLRISTIDKEISRYQRMADVELTREILTSTNLTLQLTLDDRGDKKASEPSISLALLFTSPINLKLIPSDVQLLTNLGNEAGKFSLKLELEKAKAMRRFLAKDDITDLTESYASICRNRWDSNFVPEAPSEEQVNLEVSLGPSIVRQLVHKSFQSRTAPLSNGERDNLSATLGLPMNSIRFANLRKASKFPSTTEFDVVVENEQIGVEIKCVENIVGDGYGRLLVAKTHKPWEFVTPGMVIVAINGVDTSEMLVSDLSRENLIIQQYPVTLRIHLAYPSSRLRFRAVLPFLTLNLTVPDEDPAIESNVPVQVCGLAAQFDSLVSSASVINVSIMGLGGGLLASGVNSVHPSVAVNNLGVVTASDRVRWLSPQKPDSRVLGDDERWRAWLQVDSDLDASPCIKALSATLAPSFMKVIGEIDVIALFVQPHARNLIRWINRLLPASPPHREDIVQPLPVAPKPRMFPEYYFDFCSRGVEVNFDIQAENRHWSRVLLGLGKVNLQSSETTINLVNATLQVFVDVFENVRGGREEPMFRRRRLFNMEATELVLASACTNECAANVAASVNHVEVLGLAGSLNFSAIDLSKQSRIEELFRVKTIIDNIMLDDTEFGPTYMVKHSSTLSSEFGGDLDSIENDAYGRPNLRPYTTSRTGTSRRMTRVEVASATLPEVLGYALEDSSTFSPLTPHEAWSFSEKVRAQGVNCSAQMVLGLDSKAAVLRAVQQKQTIAKPLTQIRLGLLLEGINLHVLQYECTIKELLIGARTYPRLEARCEVRDIAIVDQGLQSMPNYFSAYSHLLDVGEIVLSFTHAVPGALSLPPVEHDLSLTLSRTKPGSELSMPDFCCAGPTDFRPRVEDIKVDHTFVHFTAIDIEGCMSYDSLASLMRTLDTVTSIAALYPSPSSAAEEIRPVPAPPNKSSSAPVIGSVSVSGVRLSLLDLTRRSEVARLKQRANVTAASGGLDSMRIPPSIDRLRRLTSERRSLGSDRDVTSVTTELERLVGDAEVSVVIVDNLLKFQKTIEVEKRSQSVLLTFSKAGEELEAVAYINYLIMLMDVQEITKPSPATASYLGGVKQSRTILQPLGLEVTFMQTSGKVTREPPSKPTLLTSSSMRELSFLEDDATFETIGPRRIATILSIDIDKPLQFSMWAEEVSLFQKIAAASSLNLVEPTNDRLFRTTSAPVDDGLDSAGLASIRGSQASIRESQTSILGSLSRDEETQLETANGMARRLNSSRTLASSSRESYHTAPEGERTSMDLPDLDIPDHHRDVEKIFMVKILSKDEIGLEIVKQSLARISPDAFLPVMSFEICGLDASLYSSSVLKEDFTANTFFQVKGNSFNVRLATWEPIIEPFRVELSARKVHASQLNLTLNICSRININISEINARLLQKLMHDFSESASDTSPLKGPRFSKDQSSLSSGYLIYNLTGDPVVLDDFFQEGCGIPGKLTVEIRDAWTLPNRLRWQYHPMIEGRILPWREERVIDHVPPLPRSPSVSAARQVTGRIPRLESPRLIRSASSDEASQSSTGVSNIVRRNVPWEERPLVFQIDYKGTTVDMPVLQLLVNNEYMADIPLAAHIIDPKEGGTSEWIPLKQITGGVQSEMLIKITFVPRQKELDEFARNLSQASQRKVIQTGESCTIDFDKEVSGRRKVKQEDGAQDVVKARTTRRGMQNTLRGARLEMELFNNTLSTELQVDESGAYASKLDKISQFRNAVQLDHPEILVKSAMRPGGKRVVQLESPLILVNETNVPVEVFITRRNLIKEAEELRRKEKYRSEDGSFLRDNMLSLIQPTSSQVTWQLLPQKTMSAGGLPLDEDERAREASRIILETIPEQESIATSGVRFHFVPGRSRLPGHWSLYVWEEESNTWTLLVDEIVRSEEPQPLGSSPGHLDDTGEFDQSSSLHSMEEKEEKLERPGSTALVSSSLTIFPMPIDRRRFRLEVLPDVRLPAPSTEPADFASGLILEKVVRDARNLITRMSSGGSQRVSRDEVPLQIPLARERSDTSVEGSTRPEVIEQMLDSLGLVAIEFLGVDTDNQWKCRVCGEMNADVLENCCLCDAPRRVKVSTDQGDQLSQTQRQRKKGLGRQASRKALNALVGTLRTPKPTEDDRPAATNEFELQDFPVRAIIQPGSRFPVPLRYLFVRDLRNVESFKLYIRGAHPKGERQRRKTQSSQAAGSSEGQGSQPTVNDLHWALLVENLSNLRNNTESRYWLRCTSPGYSSHTLFSAYVQARSVAYTNLDGDAVHGERHLNRFKIGIVPWLIVQNALPFPLSLQFFDALVARDTITTLAPGQERGFVDVDEHDLVQFRVENFHKFRDGTGDAFGWSNTIHPYREEATGFSGGRGIAGGDPTMLKRFPKRKEVLSFVTERMGTLKLVMERTNDTRASLRCVIYSTCWVYNFADIGVCVKGGRSLLGTASAAAARTSSTVLSEESYILTPNTTIMDDDSHPILPALIYSGTDAVRISGIIDVKGTVAEMIEEIESGSVQDVQACRLVQVRKMGVNRPQFSKPRYSVKLTSSVLSCDFLFQVLGQIRLVTVEVRRPLTAPFSRSWQVIIRPRFTLVSLLSAQRVHFKEALSVGFGAQARTMVHELVPAQRDDLFDEDEPLIGGGGESRRNSWVSCMTPQQGLVSRPEATAAPIEGDPNHQASLVPSRPASVAHSTLTDNRMETILDPGRSIPYHFASLRNIHEFIFAISSLNADGSAGSRTSWSGVLTLTNTEGVYCVLLRDRKGSPKEPGAVRIRVELLPRTNGTTTVTFMEDAPSPSFLVDNRSQFSLEVKQSQTKAGNMIIPPGSSLPIGWDDPMKPAAVMVRAVRDYTEEYRANLLNQPRGLLRGLFARSAPALVRESGDVVSLNGHNSIEAEVDSSSRVYTPASNWYTYAMETVSEREPVRITDQYIVLRAEGVVRDSSLVLQFTEDAIGKTPRPGEQQAQLVLQCSKRKCVLAVRIESGQRLDVCERWQQSPGANRKKFHPYVVASVSGITKQNTPKYTDDVHNPDWSGEKPILFELENLPSTINFSILNKATDEREVLAIKRETLPKALFRLASNEMQVAGESAGQTGSQDPFFTTNTQPATGERTRRSTLGGGEETFFSTLEESLRPPDYLPDPPPLPQSDSQPAPREDDVWVTIGSDRWKSMLDADAKMEQQERWYGRDGVYSVRRTVPSEREKRTLGLSFLFPENVASEAEAQSRPGNSFVEPYKLYTMARKQMVVSGNYKDGWIELGPMFAKEGPTAGTGSTMKASDILPVRTEDAGIPQALPRLKVSLRVLQMPEGYEIIRDEKGTVIGREDYLRRFLDGEEMKVSFHLSSIGLSIINVAKKREVAYAIMQRVNAEMVRTKDGVSTEASLGNIQIDNHVADSQFRVALFCSQPGPKFKKKNTTADSKSSGGNQLGPIDSPVFAKVRLRVFTSHPSVYFVDMFHFSVTRLNIALEERFLAEVANVFVQAEQDLRFQPKTLRSQLAAQQHLSDYDMVVEEAIVSAANPKQVTRLESTAQPGGGGGEPSKRMMYLDSFELYPLRITIDLDLEGGRDINEADDTIAAGVRLKIPLLTLEVRDLFIRISEFKRSGWFLPSGALQSIILRHYIHQILLNSGRVLTNTNWAGNPLQAGKSVASGFYFLLREPILGARTDVNNPVYGFFQGLSAGSTALLANIATGFSETVHGVSNTAVSAFEQLEGVMEYDATIRPVAGVVEMLRDVSGALAVSSREITDEVVAMRFEKPRQVRRHRDLGADGMITEYGSGRLPYQRLIAEERRMSRRVVKNLRKLVEAGKRIAAEETTAGEQAGQRETKLDFAATATAVVKKKLEEKRPGKKPGWFKRVIGRIYGCCLAYGAEVRTIRSKHES